MWLGVCHVLRYTPYTSLVRSLVAGGAIGDIVNVQHLVDCAVEDTCAFSAMRIYCAGLTPDSRESYFTAVVAPEYTEDALTRALRNGPYGRCVYSGQNDVADHQVVSIEYEGGVTAGFTLTAFSPMENRRTRIFGTQGQIATDGNTVELYDFRSGSTTVHEAVSRGVSAGEGHAGGDGAMIKAFVRALCDGEPSHFSSDGLTSLTTHEIVFAAEEARLRGTVVSLA